MADLSGVLGQVPFLAGWKGTDQLRQQEQAGQLAQAQNLMGILSAAQAQQQRAQAMREEQEIKGVLQASGGDMGRAIQALTVSGNPRYLEMATKLKALSEKPQGQAIGSGGLLLSDGKIIPPAARPGGETKPSDLSRLMAERDALPPNDPRRAIYDNAIRKNSETARQITPIIRVGGDRVRPPSGYRYSADGETLEPIPGGPADKGAGGKPLPTNALRLQKDELDAIGTAVGINADMGAIRKQLQDAKLKLGPVENLSSEVRNFLGWSSPNSRNYASFRATLEKLRNDSLRLNKGVQTEGDAVRAWNELVKNANDPLVVDQRLEEIAKINERAVQLRKLNIDNIRNNYGAPPLDTAGYETQPPALGGGVRPNAPRPTATPTRGSRSVIDEADAILRGNNGGS